MIRGPKIGRMRTRMAALLAAVSLMQGVPAHAYAFNQVVADARDIRNNPYTACPAAQRFNTATPGIADRRWSTSLGAAPQTIFTTQDSNPAARLNEIEQSIQTAFSIWTNVSGATLRPASLGLLTRTPTQMACNPFDGINSICLNQPDSGFSTGVLAFTTTVASDILTEQPFPANPPATFTGEILDADVYFNPTDPGSTFATPAALPSRPTSFDFESVLAHELGHFFGFSHSGVWRAMMFPFAPSPGQFLGDRPGPGALDAPLAEDDRTGLRVLYPDPADTVHAGSIRGRIEPANLLSLGGQAGVTGIFGAQVAAVDEITGEVIGATLGGWSCNVPGPAQFDGSYWIERLPVGRSYRVYVEPLDGPVTSASVAGATSALCRNATTDPGWPAQAACTVPIVHTNFVTRSRQ